MRHLQRAAKDKINKLFGLVELPHMQDWEIECSDPDRVNQFIDAYSTNMESDDERFTLMALILGSFEEYHRTVIPCDDTWFRIKEILERNYDLHLNQIEYYQCYDEVDPECVFPITLLMRTVAMRTSARKSSQCEHEIWIDRNNLPGLCLSGAKGDGFRRLLDQPARLAHRFYAGSRLEAMRYYFKYMDFGEYTTNFPDEDGKPYDNEG